MISSPGWPSWKRKGRTGKPAQGRYPGQGEDDDETESETETSDDEENAVDEAQLKAWKAELTKVKKQLKTQKDNFASHLNKAVDGLDEQQAGELLLTILHNDMQAIVERYIAAQRKQIVAAFENWWDKYRVTLNGSSTSAMRQRWRCRFLRGLGYV